MFVGVWGSGVGEWGGSYPEGAAVITVPRGPRGFQYYLRWSHWSLAGSRSLAAPSLGLSTAWNSPNSQSECSSGFSLIHFHGNLVGFTGTLTRAKNGLSWKDLAAGLNGLLAWPSKLPSSSYWQMYSSITQLHLGLFQSLWISVRKMLILLISWHNYFSTLNLTSVFKFKLPRLPYLSHSGPLNTNMLNVIMFVHNQLKAAWFLVPIAQESQLLRGIKKVLACFPVTSNLITAND